MALRQGQAFGFAAEGARLHFCITTMERIVAAAGGIKIENPIEFELINPWVTLIPGYLDNAKPSPEVDRELSRLDADGGLARALMSKQDS